MTAGGVADDIEGEQRAWIEQFIRLDRWGAAGGALFVIVANGLFVKNAMVWVVLPFLVVLVGALTFAEREASAGRIRRAFIAIALGNWTVAMVVSIVLPFLWPVMILTVAMPMILATPYVDSTTLLWSVAVTGFTAGLVSIIGLVADDGGAVPDLDDTAEVVIVSGALAVHIIPIAVIAWINNQTLSEAMRRTKRLNVELTESEQELAASRRRVANAADQARSRIERDLHDGAQQRLVALGLKLKLLRDRVDDPALGPEIDQLSDELSGAVEELRELAHGIYPPVLKTNGLSAALTAVARRSPVPVELEVDPLPRADSSIEHTLYFTMLEGLTNVAKHAPAATANLRITHDAGTYRARLVDDGPGFDPAVAGRSNGLTNMRDRVEAVGGSLIVDSSPGQGTSLSISVPTLD